jgi:hypothetical protein
MEKKLNSSKLQRIVSMRNKDVDDNDTTAINSAKLAKITNPNLITTTPIISNTNTFSTKHDILKYSSSSSQQQQQQQSSSKQLGITKRHLTSSLNNINLESEKITSYPSANTSLSRKIVVSSSLSSASSATNSKEDTIIDLKTNTSFPPQHQQQHQTNAIKPVRKIAVVNGTIKKSM